MKKYAAIILSFLLMLAVSSAQAEEPVEYVSGSYKYVLLQDGTACITDYTNSTVFSLTIASELDGIPVTAIGDRAFTYLYNMRTVTIPDCITTLGVNPFVNCESLTNIIVYPSHPTLATIDGVLFDKVEKRLICYPYIHSTRYEIPQGIRIIGDEAFAYCASLTEVIIPDSVSTIGSRAFMTCRSLSQVDIPDSVVNVGGNPFSSCFKLTTIRVSGAHPVLTMTDGILYDNVTKTVICCLTTRKGSSYTVPTGTLHIADYAFYYCESLTSIILPDSLVSIGDRAFSGCLWLSFIALPEGVVSIGESAFYDCFFLQTVSVPASVTHIGPFAFWNCKSLTVTPGSAAEQWCQEHSKPYTYAEGNTNDWLLN